MDNLLNYVRLPNSPVLPVQRDFRLTENLSVLAFRKYSFE